MNKASKSDQIPIEEMSFEESYQELQLLVEKFEKGQLRLSESVERFERGMNLLKRCNQQLNEAEARVEKLLHRIEPLMDSELKETEFPDEND
ncbi:exodeoxyribonuclease VII small subunit [bacterium]|nr:exodeoxyribonuclease VII small subunit [candidate division CSSED10-310 bacterium]